MNLIDQDQFSVFEIDTFQEIMNIGFGQAAADLSEIMNVTLELGIPYLKVVRIADMIVFIKNEINDFGSCNIIEQVYWGHSRGMALLIFPHQTGKEILSIFQDDGPYAFESDNIEELEREVLIEIGNILIGACVGKISELLNDTITYEPPRLILGNAFQEAFLKGMFEPASWAILLKTVFKFDDAKDADGSGYLFLINSQTAINHIRRALAEFLEQYE